MTEFPGADVVAPPDGKPFDLERHRVALLASKLAPPDLAQPTVTRQRLLAALSRAVQRVPVTLLSGPAGSGKTTLAASWLAVQRSGQPVAWLTLDDYDDDPATFWTYVAEALSAAGVQLSEPPTLAPGEALPAWFVPGLAAELAASSRPVVLVVDNADHITDRAIVAGLDRLVRHAGNRLRLVLCARADPLLPLHQYRLAGTVAEIRSEQLAFTADETCELLAAMGVPVTPDVARRLCEESRGWAVGLRLAAAPLKQGMSPEHLVTSLAHDDGSVAQYLFAEVLPGQPASVRRFLLRISVTSELWPDLVERLTGRRNARRILAGLAHANAFVEEAVGEPGGFRIHPLFREMLQAQLAYDHPGELPGLHRTCAEWYIAAGRPSEAIGHAIAAEDWDLVSRLLIDDLLVTRLLVHGRGPALPGLESMLRRLPGTEAAVIRAAVALAGERAPVPADLEEAAAARDRGDRPTLRASAALTCLVAGAGSAVTGVGAAAQRTRADEAAALVAALPGPPAAEVRDGEALVAAARAGAALNSDAPVPRLRDELRVAAAAAQAAGARRLRCSAVAELALLEAVSGHLTRAAELAGEAEELGADDDRADSARSPAVAAARAWIHLRRYELVEARDWVGRSRGRVRPDAPAPATVDALLAVLQSQLLRLRHEYDAAQAALAPQLVTPGLPRWARQQVVAEAVRLAFARGRLPAGVALLDAEDAATQDPTAQDPTAQDGPMPGAAGLRAAAGLLSGTPGPMPIVPDAADPPAVTAEYGVLEACRLLEIGRVPAAVDELIRALELARPEAQRWPFLDAPAPVRRVLRTHPRLQASAGWLNPSAPVARPRPRSLPAPPAVSPPATEVIQQLSERELEVLRHLAELLSTPEIAATMFISVNTVRTHIRSILRKLAVSRRNQAVRRARELGVL